MSDEPSNAASKFLRNAYAFLTEAGSPSEKWVRAGLADDFVSEDRRRGLSFPDADAESLPKVVFSMWQTGAGQPRWSTETLAVRGERFAAVAITTDYGNGMLGDSIIAVGLDATLSKMQRQVHFDRDDVDGAVAELDRLHSQADARVSDGPSNAASESMRVAFAVFTESGSPSEEMVRSALTDDFTYEDRRSGPNFPDADAETVPKYVLSMWQTGAGQPRWETETLAVRGERFAAVAIHTDYGNGMLLDSIDVIGLDATLSLVQRQVSFDRDDVNGAIAELDRLHSQSEAS